MKKKIFTWIAVLAAVVLISGATLLAVASPATNADPLITLSYLNGPFRTLISGDIAAAANAISARVSVVESSVAGLDTKRAASNVMVLVNVGKGKTISVKEGGEIMLESGGASFSGSLVRQSGAADAAVSGSLEQYNMYVATGATQITASADSKIWVRNGALAS